jgi:hypothetical protein
MDIIIDTFIFYQIIRGILFINKLYTYNNPETNNKKWIALIVFIISFSILDTIIELLNVIVIDRYTPLISYGKFKLFIQYIGFYCLFIH